MGRADRPENRKQTGSPKDAFQEGRGGAMATVVKQFDGWIRGGNTNKYPWEQWTDGRVWVVTRGEDFTAAIGSFAMSCYQRAHRDGRRVRIRKNEDEGTVHFQFYDAKQNGHA